MADPAAMWLLGLVGLAGLGEGVTRALIRHRTGLLIRAVAEAAPPVTIALPARPVLPAAIRGRVSTIHVTCPSLSLPTLTLHDATLDLRDVRLNHRLVVTDGHGMLRGSLTAEDVLAMAGVGGALQLAEGTATLRWPRRGIAGVRLGVQLQPTLEGDRIRLRPTPFSMRLPSLPPGTTIRTVSARPDTLAICADLDLSRLVR